MSSELLGALTLGGSAFVVGPPHSCWWVTLPSRDCFSWDSLLQGMTVSLSNPYWTPWWATIGVKLAADGLVIVATARGRRALSGMTYRAIFGACGVFMLYLGARFMMDGFGLP